MRGSGGSSDVSGGRLSSKGGFACEVVSEIVLSSTVSRNCFRVAITVSFFGKLSTLYHLHREGSRKFSQRRITLASRRLVDIGKPGGFKLYCPATDLIGRATSLDEMALSGDAPKKVSGQEGFAWCHTVGNNPIGSIVSCAINSLMRKRVIPLRHDQHASHLP